MTKRTTEDYLYQFKAEWLKVNDLGHLVVPTNGEHNEEATCHIRASWVEFLKSEDEKEANNG